VRAALDWLYTRNNAGFLRLAGAFEEFATFAEYSSVRQFGTRRFGTDRTRLTAALARADAAPEIRARALVARRHRGKG
jgi:hypothetical protein